MMCRVRQKYTNNVKMQPPNKTEKHLKERMRVLLELWRVDWFGMAFSISTMYNNLTPYLVDLSSIHNVGKDRDFIFDSL